MKRQRRSSTRLSSPPPLRPKCRTTSSPAKRKREREKRGRGSTQRSMTRKRSSKRQTPTREKGKVHACVGCVCVDGRGPQQRVPSSKTDAFLAQRTGERGQRHRGPLSPADTHTHTHTESALAAPLKKKKKERERECVCLSACVCVPRDLDFLWLEHLLDRHAAHGAGCLRRRTEPTECLMPTGQQNHRGEVV